MTNALAHIRSLLDDHTGVELEWMSEEVVEHYSQGEVKQPWAINERTGKPERGGLLCARIFGPVEHLSCICTKYRGEKYRGTTCEKCGVVVESTEVRALNFGHLELVTSLTHPWSHAPTKRVLVLPAGTREIEHERISAALTGVNALYAELIKRNRAMARCLEKRAPSVIVDHELARFQRALDALFGDIPKRPSRGQKLGAQIRRSIAERGDIFSAPLQRLLNAAGIEWAYASSVAGPPLKL